MKAKKFWALVIILVISTSVLWAAKPEASKVTEPPEGPYSTPTAIRARSYLLEGLQGVDVMIVGLNPEVEKYGLTEEKLQKDVESILRQNSIRVLSFEETMQVAGTPALLINLSFKIKPETGYAAITVIVQLSQKVFLARDATKHCRASTWSCGSTSIMNTNNIKGVQDIVKGYVNRFCDDYLAANPKTKGEKPKDGQISMEQNQIPVMQFNLANYKWCKELDGLMIGISQVGQSDKMNDSDKPQFCVALQNIGEKDLALNLGMMLANGKEQYTTAVKLIFTDPNGKSYEFHNNIGRHAGIAGRLDPFVVPLAVGCSYVLSVNFDNHWFIPIGTSLPKGQYQITAVFEGKTVEHTNLDIKGIPLMPYWIGTIKSKAIQFNNLSSTALQ